MRGLPLPANVDVRRGLTHTELRDLYNGARCVASRCAGSDTSTARRAAVSQRSSREWRWGSQVVVSDRPVVREYVEADKSALVVPPEEPTRSPRRSLVCSPTTRSEALGAAGTAVASMRVSRCSISPKACPGCSPVSSQRTGTRRSSTTNLYIHEVREIPFRSLVSGPPASADRIALLSIWFHGHNNPRYAEWCRGSRASTHACCGCPTRIPRGIGYRAFTGPSRLHRAVLGRRRGATATSSCSTTRSSRPGAARRCSTPTIRTTRSTRSSDARARR